MAMDNPHGPLLHALQVLFDAELEHLHEILPHCNPALLFDLSCSIQEAMIVQLTGAAAGNLHFPARHAHDTLLHIQLLRFAPHATGGARQSAAVTPV